MKNVLTAICIANVATAIAVAQSPLSSAWTYQGRLDDASAAANGDYDMQFELFDSATAGTKIGTTLTFAPSEGDPNGSPVSVADGLFTVELEFGVPAFNGDSRWLEIGIRNAGQRVAFTTLVPRQPLTATPYAIQTRGIFVDENSNVGIGTTIPAFPLHIQAVQPYIQYDDTGGGSSWLVGVQGPSVGFNIQEVGAATRFVINDGGNVGIGTTSPGATLHVAGDAMISGELTIGPHAVRPAIAYGRVTGGGFLESGSSNVTSVTRSSAGVYRIDIVGGVLDTDVTQATLKNIGFLIAHAVNDQALIRTYSHSSGTPLIDRDFSFVIYRP